MINWPMQGSGERRPLFAQDVVATSHPLAAQAGLAMLRAGGNAIDAAIAAGIALVVVEPVSNGLGSDAFALVWDGGQAHALNGSGRAPQAWNDDLLAGWGRIAARGWNSVTIPGVVAFWFDLSQRFGWLPFEKLFEPAIEWAERGVPVSTSVADRWAIQVDDLKMQPGFAEAYLTGGAAPPIGFIFRFPALGRSLRMIAESQGRSFYEGELADAMLSHCAAHGGHWSAEDLAVHRSEWVKPLHSNVLGVDLYQMPLNSQGVVVPMALGILAHIGEDAYRLDTAQGVHLQIEAFKLATADIARFCGEPARNAVSIADLLDPQYLKMRAALITDRAQIFEPGLKVDGGTVVVAAGDREGRMISLLQSNFVGFGSGVVVPGTGISLHNRAASFTPTPGHPNAPGARARPLHSLLPALVTRDGKPVMAMGVTGGNMQPQGQVQLLSRILAQRSSPQSAIAAPRYRHMAGLDINLEPGISDAVSAGLSARGHVIKAIPSGYMDFGSAQIGYRYGDCWLAATDDRKDGAVAGW